MTNHADEVVAQKIKSLESFQRSASFVMIMLAGGNWHFGVIKGICGDRFSFEVRDYHSPEKTNRTITPFIDDLVCDPRITQVLPE